METECQKLMEAILPYSAEVCHFNAMLSKAEVHQLQVLKKQLQDGLNQFSEYTYAPFEKPEVAKFVAWRFSDWKNPLSSRIRDSFGDLKSLQITRNGKMWHSSFGEIHVWADTAKAIELINFDTFVVIGMSSRVQLVQIKPLERAAGWSAPPGVNCPRTYVLDDDPKVLAGPNSTSLCLERAEDGLILSGGKDKKIYIWDIQDQPYEKLPDQIEPIMISPEFPSAIKQITSIESGKFAVLDEAGTVWIWNLNKPEKPPYKLIRPRHKSKRIFYKKAEKILFSEPEKMTVNRQTVIWRFKEMEK